MESLNINILFLCVANSARSQMAEGLAKIVLGDKFWIQSAGSNPSGIVQPMAIKVLKEKGIDISANFSKSMDDLDKGFFSHLAYVITLCQEEACPLIDTPAIHLSWPLPDPVQSHQFLGVSNDLEAYRKVRDQIEQKLIDFSKQLSSNA